ncbi:MAG: hypothetical protein HW405_198 [Candidatus Berkelbacteria bacterium]|nr:hypothetical protein [Candidatus Berkelbacteria bacterium]
MCIATPVRIKSQISSSKFQIEDGRVVDVFLVPDCKIGDWLLCHADLAINKLEDKEAKEILKLNQSCNHRKENIDVSYHTSSSVRKT